MIEHECTVDEDRIGAPDVVVVSEFVDDSREIYRLDSESESLSRSVCCTSIWRDEIKVPSSSAQR